MKTVLLSIYRETTFFYSKTSAPKISWILSEFHSTDLLFTGILVVVFLDSFSFLQNTIDAIYLE